MLGNSQWTLAITGKSAVQANTARSTPLLPAATSEPAPSPSRRSRATPGSPPWCPSTQVSSASSPTCRRCSPRYTGIAQANGGAGLRLEHLHHVSLGSGAVLDARTRRHASRAVQRTSTCIPIGFSSSSSLFSTPSPPSCRGGLTYGASTVIAKGQAAAAAYATPSPASVTPRTRGTPS